MNNKILLHIIKELKNDFWFQIRKIFFRIRIISRGALNFFSVLKAMRKVKNLEIVIYTLGKSGSSSVFYTLMNELPFKNIFHLHFLSDHWIKNIFPGTPHERNIHKANSYFKHLRNQKKTKKKIKYITLVREPISRDISGFFQNYRLSNFKIDKNNIESIRKTISNSGHELSTTWFDSDFLQHTNFDVFNTKFDKKKGYQIYEINQSEEVLIILTHRLSEVFEKAIFQFLNLEVEKLINFNISSNKKDAKVIQNLKNNYFEEDNVIDEVYSSKFMNHFFYDHEIEQLKNKWKKN